MVSLPPDEQGAELRGPGQRSFDADPGLRSCDAGLRGPGQRSFDADLGLRSCDAGGQVGGAEEVLTVAQYQREKQEEDDNHGVGVVC